MLCCIDADYPEFFTETWRKARKDHNCCECGSDIAVGETYQIVSGKWDGEIDRFKSCEKCADLRESLNQVACPMYGGLAEEYANYLDYENLHTPTNHLTKN